MSVRLSSADKTGGRRYKLQRPDSPEGGSGPDYIAHVLVFLGSISMCRLYKLTLSDQAQVTLQLRASLRFSVKNFSRSTLPAAGGGVC